MRDVQLGEGWYILTDQKSLKAAIRLYGERWGIEVWHKDLKSGGYHLEGVRVSWERRKSSASCSGTARFVRASMVHSRRRG